MSNRYRSDYFSWNSFLIRSGWIEYEADRWRFKDLTASLRPNRPITFYRGGDRIAKIKGGYSIPDPDKEAILNNLEYMI